MLNMYSQACLCSRIAYAHVKVDTVVPTAACHQSSVKSLTSLFSATAISTPIVNRATAVMSTPTRSRLPIPVNRANKTTPVLPEHTQRRSLTANVAATVNDAVIARIQKRHQLTAANLTAAKRPQQPVKATQPVKAPVTAIPVGVPTRVPMDPPAIPVVRSAPPATTATTNMLPSTRKYVWVNLTTKGSYRQTMGRPVELVGHMSHYVEMSVALFTRPSRIPQPSRHPSITTGHRVRTLNTLAKLRYLPMWIRHPAPLAKLRPVYLPMRKRHRGRLDYCEAGLCDRNEDGDLFVPSYQCPTLHGSADSCRYWANHYWPGHPSDWATTPAEEDVNPKRSRKVRFGTAKVVGTFEPWYREAYGESEDSATEESEEPSSPPPPPPPSSPPPSPPPSPSPSPSSSPPPTEPEPPPQPAASFDNAWKALMEVPFPDDIDY